jgi:hypothetical protein
MLSDKLAKEAVLRIGEVSEVSGRRITVKVDKNKNLSDIFLDGDILKNISVNSYIEITKGFLSLIGKVDGERVEEETTKHGFESFDEINKNKRFLSISLAGYLDKGGKFIGGTKELPLIGNEAYILTREKIQLTHNLVDTELPSINIATMDTDDFEVALPIDGLFNTHIAIFGNTGSGKSNTLAFLYQELINTLRQRNLACFQQNSRFIIFDFNGEYVGDECISREKKVYNLSTRISQGSKLPIDETSLFDIEILSILCNATDKTQKPFLRRGLAFCKRVSETDEPENYLKNIVKKRVKDVLIMSDKVRADLMLDYLKEILPSENADGYEFDIRSEIEWHNSTSQFKLRNSFTYLPSNPEAIEELELFMHIDNLEIENNLISRIIKFLYLQLIDDVISNRAQNEHIAPSINKLKGVQGDIEKLFNTEGVQDLWEKNIIVVNLSDVNLDMKKTIPLLLSKKIYAEQKQYNNQKSLNIIIDEAHNILSKESFRETESWKDYRLETFEEIIKEGRKFGVFVTISSQRPNDISETITSQAHNYFIHRLINHRDLATISNAVSYIDKISEESIPTLPAGTCIFSGIASQMPMKLNIKRLTKDCQPKSHTLKFQDIIPVSTEDSEFTPAFVITDPETDLLSDLDSI